MVKPYSTNIADIKMLENGIRKEIWNIEELIDVEVIAKHMATTAQHHEGESHVVILADVSRTKKMSKPARDYFRTYTPEPPPKGIALLVGSGISRVIGTLFMKFSSPPYPTKLFTDEQKAIDWLLTLK